MSEMGDMKFTTAGDMVTKYYTWIEPDFDEDGNDKDCIRVDIHS